MKLFSRRVGWQETLAKIVFLLVPTFLLCYFLLWNANQSYFVILKNQAVRQTFYVGLGMFSSAIFYHFRFRFLPSFALLIAGLFLIYKGIDLASVGEFDTFFVSVQFLIFSITFLFGWLIGWGFSQLRYFSIVISAVFLLLCVILLSRQSELFFVFNKQAGLRDYGLIFGPAVLYCIYIIFTNEIIYRYRSYERSVWWALSKRLVGFLVLAILLLSGVLYFQRENIKSTLANYGGGGKEGENSLLKKNKDGTFDLKQYTKLRGSLGRSNQLLFAAYIDHFFPGTDVPNPIYMTAFYYSRFDTATQTFERDSLIPRNDLFEPNPAIIPLFSTKVDSAVIKDALKEKDRETVSIEVYKTELSPSSFVAPNIGFWVQPITVEKDFRGKFRSAYRAKSYISKLNSAYFVYNAEDPAIREFQKMRFQVLRQVKSYTGVDPKFMHYYTRMPKGDQFRRIQQLSDSIAIGKNLPVDKILAIRDYFLAKDANGKSIFTYTDNPGVPDIPNASLLKYFLFDSHKGYCAYYAGATLFMLRAMGIPSRIAVGFMTIDRSSKNKGWYWFYADQAHAWVQVYFPGYGWLDFDTTVGNEDARQSPKPDGTPPMQPPKAYLAATGVIEKVDTIHKRAVLRMHHFVFHDKEYNAKEAFDMSMDLGIASIQKDSSYVELDKVHLGDSATAVSYAEAFKDLSQSNRTADQLLKRFPNPAPIDELHIKTLVKDKDQITPPPSKSQIDETNWFLLIGWLAGIILFLVLFFLLFPSMAFWYYKLRYNLSRNKTSEAYWAFRCASYYLHVVFAPKEQQTYLQYAGEVDKYYSSHFSAFMAAYLKQKYADSVLNNEEKAEIMSFLSSLLAAVRKKESFGHRLKSFFRVFYCISFWSNSDDIR